MTDLEATNEQLPLTTPAEAAMKTSRLSRDTTRVVTALSPLRRTSTRLASSNPSPVPGSNERSPASRSSKRKREDLTADTDPLRSSPRHNPKPDPDSTSSTPSKPRRQPAKRIKGPNGTITVEPPTNWEQTYAITAEMRKRVVAPVDTMGCESAAEETRSPLDKRLQTLIALMLSSQTKDTVTFAAMRNLQENLEGGFNLQGLLDVQPERLNELICKVGFHNNKTRYIKAVAPILKEQFGGDIPDTIEGLVSLPGVGPKMAYLCMSSAWGRDEGIGVDVHVHRITNLWRWHKTSTPEQTRAELEAWLPKEKWHDINHLLVGFGQTICLPVGRRCGECELGIRRLCPSRVAGSPAKKSVKKEVVELKVEDGEVVKKEEVEVKSDDVGIKVEIENDEDGTVEMIEQKS